MLTRIARVFAACSLLGVIGCASVKNAQARDPMKCERDPTCGRARGSYADCTRQCADAPDCVQRCEQMQKQTDSLGH
jgi:hypothetical protein